MAVLYTFGANGKDVSSARYKTERGAKNAASRAYGTGAYLLEVGYISNINGMFIATACRYADAMKWEKV